MIGFYRTPCNTYPSSTNVRAQNEIKKSEKGPFNDDNYWKCFDDSYFPWDFPDSRPSFVGGGNSKVKGASNSRA